MAERSSWFAIQPGWEVAESSGALVGEVTEVVGDQDADIFDGLRIETEGGEERYVPADQVGEIVEGRVSLEVDTAGLTGEGEPGGVELTRDRDAEL